MNSLENLSGRVALVTGAGQGMGRAVAGALAARGVAVVVNDINPDAAEAAAVELSEGGAAAAAIAADVIDAAAVRAMVEQTVARFGGLHILVNNAGVLRPTKVIEIAEAEWD